MTAERQLTITRLIEASPERVWQCWTDPDLLPRWFGPEGFHCQTREIDLRVGGIWRFDMIGPDGKVWPNRHRIASHDRPRRIVFLLDDDSDATPPMEVTVELVAEGAGTRITQTILFPTTDMRAGALAFGADRLGQTTLAKLAALAEAP